MHRGLLKCIAEKLTVCTNTPDSACLQRYVRRVHVYDTIYHNIAGATKTLRFPACSIRMCEARRISSTIAYTPCTILRYSLRPHPRNPQGVEIRKKYGKLYYNTSTHSCIHIVIYQGWPNYGSCLILYKLQNIFTKK